MFIVCRRGDMELRGIVGITVLLLPYCSKLPMTKEAKNLRGESVTSTFTEQDNFCFLNIYLSMHSQVSCTHKYSSFLSSKKLLWPQMKPIADLNNWSKYRENMVVQYWIPADVSASWGSDLKRKGRNILRPGRTGHLLMEHIP